MIGLVGWLGAACLALCALPQVIKSYRTKSVKDLSWGFLGLWMAGEIFCCVYIVGTTGFEQLPLLANYLVNGLMLSYLIYAKFAY